MIRIMRFCVVVLFVFAPAASSQPAKRPITLEDLWRVKRLGKPSISPDGKWVAVDVTSFNMDDDSSNTQIWLCSTDGKTQKQLTTNKASSSGPLWSPDGKSIAFTSKRGDSTQIYVISPDGGEARQVSKMPMTPGGLKWGADSKTIYCVVWTWPDTPDDASYKAKEKAKKDDKVQAFVIDDALYRVWDKWIADGKRPVVFAVDVEKGHHHNLFTGIKRTLPVSGGSASDYDVSPEGKEICFVSESAKELGMDYNLDLNVMPTIGVGKETAKVDVEVPGSLKKVMVVEWQQVKKGQVLAEFTSIELEKRRDQELNSMQLLEAVTRSLDEEISKEANPEKKALLAEKRAHAFGEYRLAKEGVEQTRLEMGKLIVHSPRDGVAFGLPAAVDIGKLWDLEKKSGFCGIGDRKPVEPKNITADNLASDFAPVFSPDGKSVAFLRQTTKFFYADRARIMVHNRDNGKNSEISAKFDRSCRSVHWAGNDVVTFEAEDKGYHSLYAIHVRDTDFAKGGKVVRFTEEFSDVAHSPEKNQNPIAFLRSDFGIPPRLFTFSLHGEKAIEHFNDALRAEWDLGEVKNVTYKGADNDDVQMWVVYPPKFDKSKKWPCLMMIHGGPHNAITTDFHYRWNAHLFASKGYVVAIPNFHGSSGFGQKFTDSITGDMATKPFIDVMKATDYMEALPYIDKTRTTAAGASYGGYMMAWLNGHTDRYKAMICHAGVYNWHSMMASDFVRARERPLGALPFGDQSKIDKQNPQKFAANFKTPTLVMHGEKDYRVPITQGMEYYNTLRIKRVPTRFVYFPDENHWIMKPQNSRLWHREFFAWLEKHVGSGPTK